MPSLSCISNKFFPFDIRRRQQFGFLVAFYTPVPRDSVVRRGGALLSRTVISRAGHVVGSDLGTSSRCNSPVHPPGYFARVSAALCGSALRLTRWTSSFQPCGASVLPPFWCGDPRQTKRHSCTNSCYGGPTVRADRVFFGPDLPATCPPGC